MGHFKAHTPKYEQVVYTREQAVKWLKQRFPHLDFSEAEKGLPPLVWRSRWDKLAEKYGLPYSRKYLQNLDSQGTGPASIKAA